MVDVRDVTRKIRTAARALDLGRWPTPLEEHAALARETGLERLWLKREDRAGVYGGNKVRGLEFTLRDVRPGDVAVTAGGWGSNHCLATAVHARALGARVALLHWPQGDNPASRAVCEAARRRADVTVAAERWWRLPGALISLWRGARALGRPRWIPPGGATGWAALGAALGALELADALAEPPEAIVLPLGSGATAAGVALGIGWLGWPTGIVAVRVAPRVAANRRRIRALARRAARRARAAGVVMPGPARCGVLDGIGPGYGVPSAAGTRWAAAAAAHGLTLDPVYTAKAFAALPHLATCGFRRLVFWHTFAPPPAVETASP